MRDEWKLPKWAQDELRTLRMRLKEANERIAESEGPPTRVISDVWSTHPRHLPNSTRVRFFADDEADGVWFDAHAVKLASGKVALEICGNDSFVIHARLSNVIWITERDRSVS